MHAEPFNLAATVIFLLAIAHTFLTARLRHWAHEVEAAQRKKIGLARNSGASGLDGLPEEVEEDDLSALAIDPPLLFFLLFEAYKDRESLGCRLGRFGSVLVADPLFAEVNNRLQSERQHGALAL